MSIDPSFRSKLEDNEDGAIFNVTTNQIANTYKSWGDIFRKYNCESGRVLEIGSGTGRLSAGLISQSSFDEIYMSDLSPLFLNRLKNNFNSQEKNLKYFTFDANVLPFSEGAFDVIVGRSILHHIMHYASTIEQAFGALKSGGKLIFFEPVMEGKAQVALLLKLMLNIRELYDESLLSEDQTKGIKKLVRHLTKSKRLSNNLDKLSMIEDKHIFSVSEMKTLAKKIGYRNFSYQNLNNKVGWGYRDHVFSHVKRFGITRDHFKKFGFLFDSYGETISDLVEKQYSPMGFFIFEK